jgi:glycosyltransferase involved in cell wall biosynthesis
MSFSRKLKKLYFFIIDTVINFITRPRVIYVVDDFNWAIKQEGNNFTAALKDHIKFRISSSHIAPKNTIVHFGDIYTFFTKNGLKKIDSKSPIILTWYHIVENDIGFKFYEEYKNRISYLHLSNEISKKIVLGKGFPKEKIFFAPIPIDTTVFERRLTKDKAKELLNIPQEKIVIGSFQKDGNGWGEGLEPKLVKGPDIFCDMVEKLSESHDIHVLLSGPARGYVIRRLKNKNIPFSHYFFEDPTEVVKLYEALDFYLMTSRVEGGPKSFAESWAMGVPYAGTPVGMVKDHGINGKNFIEINIKEIDSSINNIQQFLDSSEENKSNLIAKAQDHLENLTLKKISTKYLNLYKELTK